MDIFLDDLTESSQREVLEFLGLENAEEGNLDTNPLFVLPKPEVNEEEEEEEEEKDEDDGEKKEEEL